MAASLSGKAMFGGLLAVMIVALVASVGPWSHDGQSRDPEDWKSGTGDVEGARALVEGALVVGMTVRELEAGLGSPYSRDWLWVYAIDDSGCSCVEEALFRELTGCSDTGCLIAWFDEDGIVCAATLDGSVDPGTCGLRHRGRLLSSEALIGADRASVLLLSGEPDREVRRHTYHVGQSTEWGDLDNWWLTVSIDTAGLVSAAAVEQY